ncbi:hypothetical protein BDA96_05G147500 [Sorghum bicolor]|uniref:Secreted protein n=1 Tax=Sorghum bicolor TaxID=4558 RepID=A0A921QY50_SORBI|nr:hypothetical protein BDA96_05G147500 [Sorghum bicolor]
MFLMVVVGSLDLASSWVDLAPRWLDLALVAWRWCGRVRRGPPWSLGFWHGTSSGRRRCGGSQSARWGGSPRWLAVGSLNPVTGWASPAGAVWGWSVAAGGLGLAD